MEPKLTNCTYDTILVESMEDETEIVLINCPRCSGGTQVSWDNLEKGASNHCDHCGFDWLVGECWPAGKNDPGYITSPHPEPH